MKSRVVITLFWSFLCISGPTAVAASQSAGDVVKIAVESVLERLTADKSELERDPDRIIDILDELVAPYFDFYEMGRLVLGRKVWDAASEGQRQTFAEQFKTKLILLYSKSLIQFSDMEVKYLDTVISKKNSKVARVHTEAHGKGQPEKVIYTLKKVGGAWKVVDVMMQGSSILTIYRGSFKSQLQRSELQEIIAKMAEQNDRLAGSSKAE